ncbi:MAG: hypothetical protein DYG98_18705 [Haliscomenobacteraceae bacterium CHB4]|nr:hypothetical protein [Saprospiraceae bacterium]MCE7925089.1 hypothetical protein [Haliscomenobacteraceae bacterium CHB4]
MNYEYQETYEFQPEYEGEFNQEMYEEELAEELLGIQNEQELEYFLGDLFKKATKGAKALYNSSLGQQIKNQAVSGLKSLGKRALPGLGSKVGGRIFGSTGARYGRQLGNMAARGLDLEFEAASPTDRRFEGAKRFIRVAKAVPRHIAAYTRNGRPVNPGIIRNIVLKEGRRWFPNLPSSASNETGESYETDGYSPSTSQNRGTWVRKGNRIILQGV